MSGTLSTLGLGSLGTGTLGELGGIAGIAAPLLGSVLSTASFRGVTFVMIDSREQAGRRLVRWLFPGRSTQRFQDFGAIEGAIQVSGLIIGDDYVIRAGRMRQALLAAGPATLVHPWWGRLTVRVDANASLSFSDRQIRLASFQATFFRDTSESSPQGLFASITDSLTNLLTTADGLVDQAVLACQAILSPLAVPLALSGAVDSYLSQASGVWDALVETSPQPVQTTAATTQASLAAGVAVPATNIDTSYADAVTTALAGVPAAIAAAVAQAPLSPVAPAALVADGAQESVDPGSVVTVLLSGALQLGNAALALSDVTSVPAQVLALGVVARAVAVTQAVAASVSVSYASQPDAIAARDTMVAAFDALAIDIENAAAAGAPFSTGAMWGALQDLRSAVIADASDRIGQLPAVIAVPLAVQTSAWAVAYAIAGDTLGDVQTVFDDLVARNDLVHPALAGPGSIDVLDLGS